MPTPDGRSRGHGPHETLVSCIDQCPPRSWRCRRPDGYEHQLGPGEQSVECSHIPWRLPTSEHHWCEECELQSRPRQLLCCSRGSSLPSLETGCRIAPGSSLPSHVPFHQPDDLSFSDRSWTLAQGPGFNGSSITSL